jgi:hypothetical protein
VSEKSIFISHASKDDDVVAELRKSLESLGLAIWADSRELTGGGELQPDILKAIDEASHLIAVLSLNAINSAWVLKEIQYALKGKTTRTDGFKVIPLLLDGLEPSSLQLWFTEEPVAIKIRRGPGGVHEALPALCAALGVQLPNDGQGPAKRETTPVADLILELTDPSIDESGGKRRATALATLTYNPPDNGEDVSSEPYPFTAPLGPIEAGELAWYLERYCHWPSGVFQERANRVEEQLPEWGKALFSAMNDESAREALEGWKAAGKNVARRLTILVKPKLPKGTASEKQAIASEAATLLLSLPWELIRDERGYLFQGAQGVRVRRRLPNYIRRDPIVTDPPIRVLLVSPRPEDDRAGYIDHRVSARPLVEALAPLGDLAALTILAPPTFSALQQELQRAHDAGHPYHVVHFDGHGVYDPKHGLGALCFEDPQDVAKLD